ETAGLVSLWVFLPLFGMLMIVIGLVFANFNALAMEPQGHVAGMASSLTGAISVLLGALIGYIIGQGYDGTMVPLFSGFLLCGLVVLAILLWVEKGRLFGAQAPA
ncbi:MAG: MFS transporter, partial [Pseudomonadota bacterium]